MAVTEEQHPVRARAQAVHQLARHLDRRHAVGVAPVARGGRDLVEIGVVVPHVQPAGRGRQPDEGDHDHRAAEDPDRPAASALTRRPLVEAVGQPGQQRRQQQHAGAQFGRRAAPFEDAREHQQGPVPQVQRVADEPDPHHRPRSQQRAVQHRVRAGGDAEEGTQRRRQRPPAREGHVAAHDAQAEDDQPQPRHRLQVRPPRQGTRPVGPIEGQQPAQEQLPEARQRRIEGGGRMPVHRGDVQQEGQRTDRADDAQRPPLAPPGEGQQQRPQDIELLLDRQRPQVQQRLGLGQVVEVAGLLPEGEVRDERGAGGRMLAELLPFAGQQQVPAEHEAHRQHQHQRREDAADPALVEAAVVEAGGVHAAVDDRADQEAGDDEEYVHADEAAPHPHRKGVEAEHRQHRHRAQAVDVGTVLRMQQRRMDLRRRVADHRRGHESIGAAASFPEPSGPRRQLRGRGTQGMRHDRGQGFGTWGLRSLGP